MSGPGAVAFEGLAIGLLQNRATHRRTLLLRRSPAAPTGGHVPAQSIGRSPRSCGRDTLALLLTPGTCRSHLTDSTAGVCRIARRISVQHPSGQRQDETESSCACRAGMLKRVPVS